MTQPLSKAMVAELLGVTRRRLATMLADGLLKGLTLEDVLAAREQGWVTMTDAIRILGVNRSRVGQLVDAGRLPCHQARPGGKRWFRIAQLQVVANAREARRLSELGSRLSDSAQLSKASPCRSWVSRIDGTC